MTYYRLFCLQNRSYMATGYNAKSREDLVNQYASYKSNDWDNEECEEAETMDKIWAKMPIEEKISFIRNDEFDIEESETEFEEQSW